MVGDILHQMTTGIENTRLVIVFITDNYRKKVNGEDERDNCLIEFRYALSQLGPQKMISVVMDSGMKNPRDWKGRLGGALGSNLYYDLSEVKDWENIENDVNFKRLMEAIQLGLAK